jgi:hypothetical protein
LRGIIIGVFLAPTAISPKLFVTIELVAFVSIAFGAVAGRSAFFLNRRAKHRSEQS